MLQMALMYLVGQEEFLTSFTQTQQCFTSTLPPAGCSQELQLCTLQSNLAQEVWLHTFSLVVNTPVESHT